MTDPARSMPLPAQSSAEAASENAPGVRDFDGVEPLGVLEEKLNFLVERHREALKTIEELRVLVQEKDFQLYELRQDLEQRRSREDELRIRLERLIRSVGALLETATGASGTGRGSPRRVPPL